ncbi:glycosyltransferase family 2 protein [Microbacterium sp. SLBN-146]|uniref:glycosyltransferase family 2 protein n=1 Tax=Microbacterium sp. SLBN-146 TaxID=2768457 RepID=UPI00114EF098|nr:glycosyltransferase family 2 protein [Microbacterium sp. SLBN-146]TQJ31723.1 glycosyltransferase involved in cell wall biosynthesis [Microbacterium sp. SLBN-146]
MTSSPALTVVVPGFDVESYAREAIDSLRAQTRHDWTAVLVDDGSTDATGSIFEAAAETDPRFHVVHHDLQRGLSAARNTGLDLATTPYIGFLDADDVMMPRAVERLVGTIERTGSDLVAGAYVRLRPDARGGYSPGDVQPWVAAATSPARDRTTLAEHPDASGNIVAWSKVSRREMWQNLRFPLGRTYEDQLAAQLLYTTARSFDVIPDVVVQWRERAEGTSITQRKDGLPVLRDYIDALAGGIAVLDAAGFAAAAASRVRLILTMDVPPLIEIARAHPDPAYRRELGAFVRSLHSRAVEPASAAVEMALRW